MRGFGTLLGYLRRVGAVPVPAPPAVPAPVTAEEELLDRYRRYLTGERGVCEQVARGVSHEGASLSRVAERAPAGRGWRV